jgi:hypothetical protein
MATMTNIYTQAFRTTCIPAAGDRFGDIIPSEYIGQKLEIIILPQFDSLEYNAETLAAMQEAEDIASGKIQTKSYKTVAEMEADLDAEEGE